jgi:hypothetical protein
MLPMSTTDDARARAARTYNATADVAEAEIVQPDGNLE